ncbi:hypothetical protein MD484_g6101, partial [Candolleomyces efflorescens]
MPISTKGALPPISTSAAPLAQRCIKSSGIIDGTGGRPRSTTLADATAPVDSDEQLRKCGRTFVHYQPTSTPIVPKIATTRLDPLMEEQQKILQKELSPFILTKSSFASSLYNELACSKEIDKFLDSKETDDVYSNDRWALPLSDPKLPEETMYEPLIKLLRAILSWEWKRVDVTGRTAIDTHLTKQYHKEPVPTKNNSRPDVSVKAEGPSFQLPHKYSSKGPAIGFSNIITFVEVKVLNNNWSSELDMVLQVAAYARQIFINQPNRRFVRALVVTEQTFRLFHFDRSGVQFTKPIDIHKKHGAHIFVRLVLGLCSSDERDVGLDTSIHWEIKGGVKVSGTLRMHEHHRGTVAGSSKARARERTVTTYTLANTEPIVSCYNIRSRGVVCWAVIDPQSGKTFLVRDVWRSDDRVHESSYLNEAKDIPGVVTMISYDNHRGSTKDMRSFGKRPHNDFRNRVATRTVLDTHGKSIKHFKSPMELICAIRDAIDGHRQLYLKKILHRDIALENIMLGRFDAPTGSRGALIGLDMAILSKRNVANSSTDWKMSTGIYQSIMVLMSGQQKYPLAHDHLDDLESFVHVLAHVMNGYDQTGVEYPLSGEVKEWPLCENIREGGSKAFYLDQDYEDEQIKERWPPSCINLLRGLKKNVHETYRQRARLATQKPQERKDEMKALAQNIPEHYQTILSLFDEAIGKLESSHDTVPLSPAGSDPMPGSSSSYESGSSSPVRAEIDVPSSSPKAFVNFSPPPKRDVRKHLLPVKAEGRLRSRSGQQTGELDRHSVIQGDTASLGKRKSVAQQEEQPPTKRSRLAVEPTPRTPPRRSNKVKFRAPKRRTPRKCPSGGKRPL